MASNQKAANTTEVEHEPAPILQQMFIFGLVLFVSSLISPLFPASFPVPTPVLGIVILYLLLTFKIVKLWQVEKMGDFLVNLIAFLFVPSGIQMTASLDIMAKSGVQLILVIICATLIMLVVIAYTTAGFMYISRHVFHKQTDVTE